MRKSWVEYTSYSNYSTYIKSSFFRHTDVDAVERDTYSDTVDWDVLAVYPRIFRAYAPLFTTYTDRAFPNNNEIDSALRYALRYEVGGFYTGVQNFERAVEQRNQRDAQKAFARMSISFDHYHKAGDLYEQYEPLNKMESYENADDLKLTYIAPSSPYLYDYPSF